MKKYLRICRIDNIPKQIFIVPGIFLASLYTSIDNINFWYIILGFICAILSASSNYVINEYLDRKNDKFHPLKKKRLFVKEKIDFKKVFYFYFFLIITSLVLSYKINQFFFITNILFIISGLIYNLKPFRLKDRVHLDVINESINNPIRLFLGWYMVIDNLSLLPPISLILFYWFSGGFLMTSKRLSEIKFFYKYSNLSKLKKYRPNYKHYNENNLTLVSIVYLMLISFNSAIFLLKYREELILIYPFLIILFSTYFYLSITLPEKAIFPEKIYLNKIIIFLTITTFILFFVLFYFDIPMLKILIQRTFN